MAESYVRFNCNVSNDDYRKFLKLQKYYSKKFGKKLTLTDTFNMMLKEEYGKDIKIEEITID